MDMFQTHDDKLWVVTYRIILQIQGEIRFLCRVTGSICREKWSLLHASFWRYDVRIQLGGALGQPQNILEGLHIQSGLGLPQGLKAMAQEKAVLATLLILLPSGPIG